MTFERRMIGEVRTTGRTLHGVAAPFGRPAQIGGFIETIEPGAFAASIGRDDVRALCDHREDALLGRTRSGSLHLRETGAGLEYTLDLPSTTLAADLLALARRGDLGGVSIGFRADWEAWPTPTTRTLRAVSLAEISIITGGVPAYSHTTIAVRQRDATRDGADVLRRLRMLVI